MDDWITKLERAKRLLDAGALSEEEFDQEKARLLADAAVVDGPPRRRFRVPGFSSHSVPLALGGAAIVAALLGYLTWSHFIADVEMPNGPTSAISSPNFEIGELPSDLDEPVALTSTEVEIDDTEDEASVERAQSEHTKRQKPLAEESSEDEDDTALAETQSGTPQKPAEPRNYPGSWVTPNDYPAQALREDRSGVTTFRVTIDEVGHVSDCMIVQSSGHIDLDQKTCELVTQRARFTRPSDGYSDNYTNRVRWTL